MDKAALRALLDAVRAGETSVDAAESALVDLPFTDLGFARVDHHRAVRQGMPEVVYGAGKSAAQIVDIGRAILSRGDTLLVTRVDDEKAARVREAMPELEHDPIARTLLQMGASRVEVPGVVLVLSAGTSDLPVAREAMVTLRASGAQAKEFHDVGVAGIHRLFAVRDELMAADCILCVAGMEGALPSVVGGLVSCPVVAVPTSVGYGANLGGVTTLLAMATGCAAGVTLVNVDNGFGAAIAARRILGARHGAR